MVVKKQVGMIKSLALQRVKKEYQNHLRDIGRTFNGDLPPAYLENVIIPDPKDPTDHVVKFFKFAKFNFENTDHWKFLFSLLVAYTFAHSKRGRPKKHDPWLMYLIRVTEVFDQLSAKNNEPLRTLDELAWHVQTWTEFKIKLSSKRVRQRSIADIKRQIDFAFTYFTDQMNDPAKRSTIPREDRKKIQSVLDRRMPGWNGKR